jgi:hypothetical protein
VKLRASEKLHALFPTCLHSLSLFTMAVHVVNRLEKLQRDFISSGMDNEFKYHLGNLKAFLLLFIRWFSEFKN